MFRLENATDISLNLLNNRLSFLITYFRRPAGKFALAFCYFLITWTPLDKSLFNVYSSKQVVRAIKCKFTRHWSECWYIIMLFWLVLFSVFFSFLHKRSCLVTLIQRLEPLSCQKWPVSYARKRSEWSDVVDWPLTSMGLVLWSTR